MDINFELGDLKFVWDSEKAKINWKKHKVYFETAVRVFLDENNIDDYDEIHSDFEDRNKIIGKVGKVLVVIYTERSENIRIISARLANKKEQEDYYEQFY
ncbi:MAG: BrnT family toxin [Selenomonadaceae bacterium]|nr:BrnT family toxin [Selenomonadaceae bacterium]